MAASNNVFADKETNNWFKACLALNVTKQGLINFLDKELQNIHAVVGRSCGKCPIEKLICCNKMKMNNCPFHKLQTLHQCQTCDTVKHNIASMHRFCAPSWRNTHAEKWTTDYWEIGKCFLPPDGYSSVSSVKGSDFNGLINIMLNCKHFDICLSSACLSPPPPDKQCLLEKIRQIGRDVRHTTENKFTDADLQSYFQTLSTLLADPMCLLHDRSAMVALKDLYDNDRMSLSELGRLLKEAIQTVEQAKEDGKRFSTRAENTLTEGLHKLEVNIHDGEQRIESRTHDGEQRIESRTHGGEKRIERRTHDGEQRIERRTHDGEQLIYSRTQDGEQRIESGTHDGEQRIERRTHDGEQRIESRTHYGEQRIERRTHDGEQLMCSRTQDGEQRIKRRTHDGEQLIESRTHYGEQRIENTTHDGEQRIGNWTHDGEQRIDSRTHAGEQRIDSRTHAGEQRIDSRIHDGEQRIDSGTHAGEQRIDSRTHDGEQRIDSRTHAGEQRIDSRTHDEEQRIDIRTHDGEQRIDSRTHDGEQLIESRTHYGEQRIENRTHDGEQRIENRTHDGEQHIDSRTHDGEQRIDSRTHAGEQRIDSRTHDGEQRIDSRTHAGEQRIDSRTHDGEQRIDIRTHDGEQRIDSRTHDGEQRIDSRTHDGEQRIDSKVCHGEQRLDSKIFDLEQSIEHAPHKKTCDDYERGVAELIQCIKKYYNSKLSHVTISALNDAVDEKLRDLYMLPKICVMRKEKGTYNNTEILVTKYKDILSTDDQENTKYFFKVRRGLEKTTFATKLALDWCLNKSCDLSSSKSNSHSDDTSRMFDDLNVLQDFMFVFHIRLRTSFKLSDVTEMIKNQIIDNIYTNEDRKKAYALLNEIMKRERCLVLLDGLDEWIGSGGYHNLPTLVENHSRCILLITTRPWKLAEENVKDSDIYRLFQLEGIHDPFKLSKIILSCLVDKKELDERQTAFERYIRGLKINDLILSPMMLSVIVCSYIEGTELKGSKCEIYSLILDSLLKKASSQKKYFQQPRFMCLKETQYVKPNIENVNHIAEAAFRLLFSYQQEHSIVFGAKDLEALLEDGMMHFALKTGIITETNGMSVVRSSSTFSFIHKSVQEFLAAYHIAYNERLLEDVISEYIKRHEKAFLDIRQVFIFLCGLNISAANALSHLMNVCAIATVNASYNYWYQDCVFDGYREGVANKQTGINLKLSHFYIRDVRFLPVLRNVWYMNVSNAMSLDIRFGKFSKRSRGMSEFSIVIDLSLCHKLKELKLSGEYIEFKDTGSSNRADILIWITLRSADPALYESSTQLLPCIKDITLSQLTCSVSWIRSLFRKLLTFDHEVKCELLNTYITSCVENAANVPNPCVESAVNYFTPTRQFQAFMTFLNNTLSITWMFANDSPGLCEALRGLKIKSLRLKNLFYNMSKWLVTSLSAFTQLETLIIKVREDTYVGLSKALHGLNIKNLSLHITYGYFNNADCLLTSIQSLKRLETLSIDVHDINLNMWKAIYSLNIKRVTLRGRGLLSGLVLNNVHMLVQTHLSKQMKTIYIDVNAHADSLEVLYGLDIKSIGLCDRGERLKVNTCSALIKSLTLFKTLRSLKQLEKLCVIVTNDSIGIWMSLRGLNIKSLSLCGWGGGLNVKYVSFLSQSLASFTYLETLSIKASEHNPGLWKALSGLNIKCLSLDGWGGGFEVKHVDSISQSLSSLTKLETLNIIVKVDSPGLWKALQGLKITSLSLRGSTSGLRVTHVQSMSQSLSSLTQLANISFGISAYSRGLWNAYSGLNIKMLSWWGVKDGSPSPSSLTKLETLCIYVSINEHSIGLWEVLRGLNIKSLSLRSVDNNGLFVNNVSMLSQSILSLTHLESLTVHLRKYINIQLPLSLKYLNLYYDALLPSELRELVYKLSASTNALEGNLAFNCASYDDIDFERIPPEDYIKINQELYTSKHVAVKRFRIYDRTTRFIEWFDFADDVWSLREDRVVDDDDHGDDIVEDDAFTTYVQSMSQEIINRISMRIQIISAIVSYNKTYSGDDNMNV